MKKCGFSRIFLGIAPALVAVGERLGGCASQASGDVCIKDFGEIRSSVVLLGNAIAPDLFEKKTRKEFLHLDNNSPNGVASAPLPMPAAKLLHPVQKIKIRRDHGSHHECGCDDAACNRHGG